MMLKFSRMLPAALVLCLAMLGASCGSDTKVKAAPTGADSERVGGDAIANSDPADSSDLGMPSGGGSCSVKVEGDVNAEWESPGGVGALNMEYWIGEEYKSVAGEGFYFIINCGGTGMNSVNLLATSGVTGQDIPFGPATLVIRDARGSTLAFDASDSEMAAEGAITALVSFDGSDTNWGTTGPGVLDITAFDADHIAGTFSIEVEDSLAGMSGAPSEGTATVTGAFDLDNPNP